MGLKWICACTCTWHETWQQSTEIRAHDVHGFERTRQKGKLASLDALRSMQTKHQTNRQTNAHLPSLLQNCRLLTASQKADRNRSPSNTDPNALPKAHEPTPRTRHQQTSSSQTTEEKLLPRQWKTAAFLHALQQSLSHSFVV